MFRAYGAPADPAPSAPRSIPPDFRFLAGKARPMTETALIDGVAVAAVGLAMIIGIVAALVVLVDRMRSTANVERMFRAELARAHGGETAVRIWNDFSRKEKAHLLRYIAHGGPTPDLRRRCDLVASGLSQGARYPVGAAGALIELAEAGIPPEKLTSVSSQEPK